MNDKQREMKRAYRDRHPEMGVLYVKCLPTGDYFVTPARDLPGKTNSLKFQLSAGNCPNPRLQALWQEHGSDAFEWGVESELDYKDPKEDHKGELETLYEIALINHPDAERISRTL